MKRKLLLLLFIIFSIGVSLAQPTTEDVLNMLVNEHVIKSEKVDSLRADIAVEQQKTPKDKTFTVDVDFRTRSEIRSGYGKLRNDTSHAATFTNQRSRIMMTYKQEGKFIFHTSFQDIRVWGNAAQKSTAGTVQIFEAWVQPFITPKLSVKIGKQKLAFDNQRLFAENDWRPQSGTHDAFNLVYRGSKLSSDLAFAFNQNAQDINTAEEYFGTSYNNAATYKALGVSYLKWNASERWTLSAINSAEGLQTTKVGESKEKMYMRYTDGGRIEYEKGRWYFTTAAYLQSGWLASGKKVTAWYVQPEIKYTANSVTIRLGAEVFSGDDARHPISNNSVDHNFNTLYGVAHRFNGNMEFFTQKPANLSNAGMINPYLFFVKRIGKKVELKADFHTFYSENNYVVTTTTSPYFKKGALVPKYLGFENDLLLSFFPNAFTKIDLGASYAIATHAMSEILSKSDGYYGNTNMIPTWYYVSLSFKPQLFKYKF